MTKTSGVYPFFEGHSEGGQRRRHKADRHGEAPEPGKALHMVVVKGFGREPMMLITSLPVSGTFKLGASDPQAVISDSLQVRARCMEKIGCGWKSQYTAEHL